MSASDTLRRRSGQAGCIALAVLGLCVMAGPRQALSQGNGRGQPTGPDVRVVNTPANPVPVVGQVAVNALPAVQLDTTEPLPVRDVDNPAGQPFQTFLGAGARFEVPAGKRLVIEHMSGSIFTNGGLLSTQVTTTAGGITGAHVFPPPKEQVLQVGGFLGELFVFAHQTRLYADPGSFVSYENRGGGTQQSQSLAISGYLVDVP